jgi:hypothetical protein
LEILGTYLAVVISSSPGYQESLSGRSSDITLDVIEGAIIEERGSP